ncbi:hypothetical protein [Actinokineospora sp.]|uniref:hypothetical protein n=1 Tax=Actinokineospora sp. TaxID=1872133 RepID=UPI004038018C
MSDARLADALARLDQHRELHLPLRRGDLLGRLALRFLWRRQLKWQVEANLAARDAIGSLHAVVAEQRAEIQRLSAVVHDSAGLARADDLRHEVESLKRADQNIMAGLNQRIYASIGGVRSEVGDLRLQLAEKAEASGETDQRLAALEASLAELVAAARDGRLRHAQVDLFLDEVRAALPARPTPAAVAKLPERGAHLELAVAELLDGPVDHVRAARAAHLPVVRQARKREANGPVFDMAPARGEWLEVLRGADIPWRSASANPHVVRQCTALGLVVDESDALTSLSTVEHRSLGAVTAFRFVERLDAADVARFVALAGAALQPGGVLVVETSESTEDFHLDPFAQRPVHPTLLRFLAEAAGLRDAEVTRHGGRYTLTARR